MDVGVKKAMLGRFGFNIEQGEEEIKSILRLDSSEDSVEYIDDSLGFQSVCYRVRGARWGNGAFVKSLPPWDMQTILSKIKDEDFKSRVDEAKRNGLNDEEAKAWLQDMDDEHAHLLTFEEQHVQMIRERTVLRVLNKTYYKLPESSVLVVPKLFDNAVGTDHKHTNIEEQTPTTLVCEDLTAIGFKPQKFDEPISDDDFSIVATALADFHGLLWNCRDQLGFETQKAALLLGKDIDKSRAFYKSLITETINRFSPEVKEFAVPHVDDICDGYADNGLTPIMMVHGDPWAQNVMLRRDATGKINGVAFVDLGNVRAGHPVQDFCCFITTMVEKIQKVWSVVIDQYMKRLMVHCPEQQNEISNMFNTRDKRHGFASSLVYFNSEEPTDRQLSAFGRARHSAMCYKDEMNESETAIIQEIRKRK